MRATRANVVIGAIFAAIVLIGCGRGNATPTPTTTTSPTPSVTATATPTRADLEAAVRAAYLAYWDAYAQAVLQLDATLVERVATGDELQGIRNEIASLKANGTAVRIRVTHDVAVVSLAANDAVLVDEYLSRSFLVDPVTKLPEEGGGPGKMVKDTITMKRIDGRWLVAGGTREAR